MDSLLQIIFGGLGGSILTASVLVYLNKREQVRPSSEACELLKKIERILQSSNADYYFTESANDNYQVANHIYMHANASIISTAFSEDPSTYGERDLVRAFRYGSLFTRITCEEVCNTLKINNARKSLEKVLPGSQFVLIPKGEIFTRIDGIFCKFKDGSYLCVIAFRDPNIIQHNKGIVFRNGIAKGFYDYYRWLSDKYNDKIVS